MVRRILGNTALVLLSLVTAVALAEGGFALLLARPALAARLPGKVLSHLRAYYLNHDRALMQAMPECARYDPGLFYTLKPGACRFEGREFSTEVRINSAGLRDDEASLQGPEVIVVGDSFAAGWGVGQDDAFPQVLEALSGLEVLNAGVPSYGTVREARLLDRLDTGRLRTLVIQYDDNDLIENLTFAQKGNGYEPGSERLYRQDLRVAGERRGVHYPGRYTLTILRDIAWPPPAPPRPRVTPREEARVFVNALLHATRKDLGGVRVLVLELNPYGVSSSAFALALMREIGLPGHKPFIRGLGVIDLFGKLTQDDYFVLDDHLRASGHVKVARAILASMGEATP